MKRHCVYRFFVRATFGWGRDRLDVNALAAEFNVTRERIRQVRNQALRALPERIIAALSTSEGASGG